MSHMTFLFIVFGTVFFIAIGLALLMLVYVLWEGYKSSKKEKEKLNNSNVPRSRA